MSAREETREHPGHDRRALPATTRQTYTVDVVTPGTIVDGVAWG